MAQTAVEWLIGKIKSYGKHDAVIMNERYFSESKLLGYLEQAKAMEKEQIIKARHDGFIAYGIIKK